ncbi:RICIN domain-containing protein [Actinacidiphila bryophytorum]|uniref:Ricin-type beta-trefoil lectin domain protein n=1 Tax=Actinacidiphila bryophytorum TaxID=1436133 RepID=A0A9W4GXS6_9ACTN|nr:hypothetical protein [Actinacidiphila bryophytorum]MBM9437935.1 hypothetical protein [Actinacidiphila bryophytorum]MBN6542820.1 hypothetical protein [Actinacidiphila bryophytorum]CAG7623540.1 Ricin-type beta-trefoil lectin domain protein [Actinacidiphila bryophytorum]
MKSRKTLHLTLPMLFAAVMLTVTGSMSSAFAATDWVYKNAYEGNCLTGSTTTSNVWSGPCDQSIGTYWNWGSSYTAYPSGITYRQLKSAATGKCLTTDDKTSTNAVWLSACDSGLNAGQLWNGDYSELSTYSGENDLRTSANGDAVYSTPWGQSGIEVGRWTWNGTHY